MVADGWFVLRENYCWLVAHKPNENGRRTAEASLVRRGADHTVATPVSLAYRTMPLTGPGARSLAPCHFAKKLAHTSGCARHTTSKPSWRHDGAFPLVEMKGMRDRHGPYKKIR
jgi:hypothetical protein